MVTTAAVMHRGCCSPHVCVQKWGTKSSSSHHILH